jgi:hypothetical protein
MRVDTEDLAMTCIKIALLAAAVGTFLAWGDWFAVAIIWAMTYPLAMFLGLLAGYGLHFMGATMQKQNLWVNDDDINIIERSPEIVGKLGENTIHEWVLLKRPDNGEHVKCLYEKFVDINKGWEPPDNRWFVVLEGGLLYVAADDNAKLAADAAVANAIKVAQPENSEPAPPKAD